MERREVMMTDKQMVEFELRKLKKEAAETAGFIARLERIIKEAPGLAVRASHALETPEGEELYNKLHAEYNALFEDTCVRRFQWVDHWGSGE